jgi:hypothetical protein
MLRKYIYYFCWRIKYPWRNDILIKHVTWQETSTIVEIDFPIPTFHFPTLSCSKLWPRVMKKNTTQFFYFFNFFFNFKTVIKYCSVLMVYNLWIFISQSQIYIIHFFKLLLCYLIIWYFSEHCFIYSVTYVVLLINTVSL